GVDSGLRERAEHLHDEHGLAVVLEGGPDLVLERREDLGVRSEHLGAHAVGDDLEARASIEPGDEVIDRWNEVRIERIETDFHSDMHASSSSSFNGTNS